LEKAGAGDQSGAKVDVVGQADQLGLGKSLAQARYGLVAIGAPTISLAIIAS